MQSLEPIYICATTRLTFGIHLRHQLHEQAKGHKQWQALEVYTLQQWLNQLLGNGLLLGIFPTDIIPPVLLTPVAESYLWEQAIEKSLAKHEAAALFDIRSMAKSAIEANDTLFSWQISEADIKQHFMNQEVKQFLRWRKSFESLCIKENAIEASRLMALQIKIVEKYYSNAPCNFPRQIIFEGFDRFTPLENHLLKVLNLFGIEITVKTQHEAQVNVNYYALNDCNAECRAAVAWAKQKLIDNPNAQLAIISPVLGNIRRTLIDLLDDTFHPHTLQPSHFEAPRCYDFSLGLPLDEYPIVFSALQLLNLATSNGWLRFEEVTPILLDSYWGVIAELDARAQFDAYLRQYFPATYRLDSLMTAANKMQSEGMAIGLLVEHLEIIRQFQFKSSLKQSRVTPSNQSQLPSKWANDFFEILKSLNWANSRTISSHEYQSQQAFYKQMSELDALDKLLGNISAKEALRKVMELCKTAIFQPEATGDTHIQILGLLETPALQLDAVWSLNMNDQHWPPPAKLNPLLPAQLQRELGTPNACAGVQSEFAGLVHQRLMQYAPEVIFSYALKEDERELRASPLLQMNNLDHLLDNRGFANKGSNYTVQTLAERLAQPVALQMLDDYQAPAVTSHEKTKGGVKLFSAQAICPAWAFYQYRLGAGKLEKPVDGLDTLSRGNLLHKVLQHFWQACGNSANLKAMTHVKFMGAVSKAIEQGIASLNRMNAIAPQIMQIEKLRLKQLLQRWLEIEMERSDFTVQACEQSFSLTIEGLSLNLTIDRIDCLAEGGLVVIDYKSSTIVSSKSWADNRISEPQLPIYAAIALKGEQVVAVCLAKIHTQESKFIGLSAEESLLPAISTLNKTSAFKHFLNWEALLQHWHSSLGNMALEIKSGVAGTVFKKESDLEYCAVKPLLRLPERALQFEKTQFKINNNISKNNISKNKTLKATKSGINQ